MEPDRLIVGMTVGRGQRNRSAYFVAGAASREGDSFVWIIDRNGWKSVTNDAERVCAELARAFGGGVRIIYLDSTGEGWDELRHDNGVFIGYVPARHLGIST